MLEGKPDSDARKILLAGELSALNDMSTKPTESDPVHVGGPKRVVPLKRAFGQVTGSGP
jgi:hypothetical protein